jgi:hypothetical protein
MFAPANDPQPLWIEVELEGNFVLMTYYAVVEGDCHVRACRFQVGL